MTGIVLVNARCERYSQHVRIEHLGLGYLASSVRSRGWEAQIIDAQFHQLSAEDVVDRLIALPSTAQDGTISRISAQLTPGAGVQGGTPSDAIAAGADYVIVGRAITEAPDPAGVARRMGQEIQSAAKH